MNAAAASQSLSDASVAAQSAKEKAKTEYERFKQGVVEGVTGPLGVDLLEKAVEKGGLKVAQKLGLGDAFKDWQEGGKGVQGLANAAKGAIERKTGVNKGSPTSSKPQKLEKPNQEEDPEALESIPEEEPEDKGKGRFEEPDDTEAPEDQVPDNFEGGEGDPSEAPPKGSEELRKQMTPPEDEEEEPLGFEADPQTLAKYNTDIAEQSSKLDITSTSDGAQRLGQPDPSTRSSVPSEEPATDAPSADPESSTRISNVIGDTKDVESTESTMAKLTAVSAEDDFNPAGLVITAGLAIGTLFAGIFGHHRDGLPKHPPVPPPVMNASTQFGVAQ